MRRPCGRWALRERCRKTGRSRAWCALADWLLTRKGTFRKASSQARLPRAGHRCRRGASARARKADFGAGSSTPPPCRGSPTRWHRLRSLAADAFRRRRMGVRRRRDERPASAANAFERRVRQAGTGGFHRGDAARAAGPRHRRRSRADLLLAIDYRLSHLLIDEFQDTSKAQLALIGRLMEGWQPGDGRTLFAVGDPMQSIYRFRQAEVRLFIEAQAAARVASVPVGVVELGAQLPVAAQRRRLGQRRIRARAAGRVGHRTRRSGLSPRVRRRFEAGETSHRRSISCRRAADEAETVVARICEARAAGHGEYRGARSRAQSCADVATRTAICRHRLFRGRSGGAARPAGDARLAVAGARAGATGRSPRLAFACCARRGAASISRISSPLPKRPSIVRIVEAIGDAGVTSPLPPASRGRIERLRAAIGPALRARGHAASRCVCAPHGLRSAVLHVPARRSTAPARIAYSHCSPSTSGAATCRITMR